MLFRQSFRDEDASWPHIQDRKNYYTTNRKVSQTADEKDSGADEGARHDSLIMERLRLAITTMTARTTAQSLSTLERKEAGPPSDLDKLMIINRKSISVY